MKAHVAVDAHSGSAHTVTTTAANEADVEQIADLLHSKEQDAWAVSGYRGAQTCVDREDLQWHIAARPSEIAKLPEGRRKAAAQKREHRKASVRAKVEHPFPVIKRQFGLTKVRFRGLATNTAHVVALFGLSNLWMVRRQLMAIAAVRPPRRKKAKKHGEARCQGRCSSSISSTTWLNVPNARTFARCSDLP
jgi:IS5 family transposase